MNYPAFGKSLMNNSIKEKNACRKISMNTTSIICDCCLKMLNMKINSF